MTYQLIHGDCLDVLASFGDKTVDHAIFDAPYEAEAHTKARRSLKDSTQRRGAVNTGKVRRIDQPLVISFGAITEEERTGIAIQAARVTRRWVMTFCQIEAVGTWRKAFEAAGLEWIRGGIWRKPNGAPQFTGDRPGQGFECIAIAHAKLPTRKRWNGEGKHAVWTVPLDHGAGGGERNEHPTQKPLDLMLDLVRDFTDEGETILDPFAGSGTTGIAALRLGRHFIGIEKDATYAALARDRLEAEVNGSTLRAARAGQTTLFGKAK